MTPNSDFENLHSALATRFAGVPVATTGKPKTNLHLYHAPNSICSQKVRAVLAAIGQPYVSHPLDIFRGDSYEPAYVRLRMMGCRAAGLPLASHHPGTTAVTSIGCDACVVPTLVATDSHEVIVDSRYICLELDRRSPFRSGALMPQAYREKIDRELAIVDNLPNYQLLAGVVDQAGGEAPNNSFALSKVRRCDALIAANIEDALLSKAYMAKRSKEQTAADRLFEAIAVARARAQVSEALRDLELRLPDQCGPLLFGASITMADLFWGVELIRCSDLGLSNLWSDGVLPKLGAYYDNLVELSALRKAVVDWPGARLKTTVTAPQLFGTSG